METILLILYDPAMELILLVLLSCAAILSWTRPKIIIGIIIFSLILGEFSRIPLSIGLRGILLTDLLTPLLVGIWLIKQWSYHKKLLSISFLTPLFLFLCINILALISGLDTFSIKETLTGGLYFFRFLTYCGLGYMVAHLVTTEKERTFWIYFMIGTGLLLALLGFAQLIIYPDFKEMAEIGWDPHINRLLGTWFDPNFIGGFFGMILALAMASFLEFKSRKSKILLLLLSFPILLALLFTYSRSGYLMFFVAASTILLLRKRTWFIALCAIILISIPLSNRAQERVMDMVNSGFALMSNSYEYSLDPTAQLRVKNWQETGAIFADSPLIGVGYNMLGPARIKAGYEKNPDSHAASGADSSLLLILATTGIFGFIAFLWIHLSIAKKLYTIQRKSLSPSLRALALGTLATLFGLLIHSLFVNSLFFAFMIIPVWIAIGLSISPKSSTEHYPL